jgi:hypothetical protein
MGDEEGTFCNPEAAANIEDIRHLLYVMLYIFCPFAVASSCSVIPNRKHILRMLWSCKVQNLM